MYKDKKKKINASAIMFTLVVVLFLPVMNSQANLTNSSALDNTNWWNIAWSYRKLITIDHTKVASNLKNFPILINISSDTDLATRAQNDGDDITFILYSDNTTKLNHELEFFNSTTGRTVAWVNITSLSSTIDTKIWMYYGNLNANKQENIEATWDSNFLAVQHLAETSGTAIDSTFHHKNGTLSGSPNQNIIGKIDGADSFDGVNDHITLPRVYTTENQFTLETWIYPQTGARYFISQRSSTSLGVFIQMASDDYLQYYINGVSDGISVSLNTWYHIVLTYDGTTANLYTNGVTRSKTCAPPTWPSEGMYLGDRSAGNRQFHGTIDEVRFSNIARTNGWITTEYNNQNTPLSFYSLGSQEKAPSVGNRVPTFSNPSPVNGTTGVNRYHATNVTVSDLDGNTTTVCFWYSLSNSSYSWTKTQQNNSAAANTTVRDINSSYSSGWNTQYWWKVTAYDGHANSSVIYTFTTKIIPVNNPPYVPSQPNPANGATNVLLNAILSWTGGDPDGNSVTYDVYFGTTSSPPKVKSNQSTLSYTPGTLSYNTIYYWKIVAWDNYSASAKGPLWSFTTKQLPPMKVIITKPLENTLYIQDKEIMSIRINTIIYGRINITADVTSELSIARVEFYVDGKLKGTDTAAPYTYLWNPLISFNGASLKHTIKAVAYDSLGNSASAELNVTKWRFHALPFIVAGAAIASKLLLHTTVRGLVLNLKEKRISVSFYAIRAQYITTGPFRYSRGTINFKSCTGGILIGPIKMKQIGHLHKFAYGTFTFLGDINYNSGGFGQGLIRRLI